MSIKLTETSFLATSTFVAWTEFVELTGIDEPLCRELMELGWLEPVRQTGQSPLFRHIDVYRVRKVQRICQDFELPPLAGTIIVDLLQRIRELEGRCPSKPLHNGHHAP